MLSNYGNIKLNRINTPKVQWILRTADINLTTNSGTAYNTTASTQTITTNSITTTIPVGAPYERTIDYVSATGDINRWQSRMIWKNINLNSIVSPIYRKNALYCLKLESVVFGLTSNLSQYTTVENNRNFNVFISGLTFVDGQTSELLCSVRVPHGAQVHIFNYFNNELYFYLKDDTTNITIEFRDLLLNTAEPIPSNNTVAYPHSQYIFSVSLVDENFASDI